MLQTKRIKSILQRENNQAYTVVNVCDIAIYFSERKITTIGREKKAKLRENNCNNNLSFMRLSQLLLLKKTYNALILGTLFSFIREIKLSTVITPKSLLPLALTATEVVSFSLLPTTTM